MLRKTAMTGLLLFFKKGSAFQLVAAMLMSLGFLAVAAWFQPYASRAANLFKVATEVSTARRKSPHLVWPIVHRSALPADDTVVAADRLR